MIQDQNNIGRQEPVLEFIDRAQEFCAFIEACETLTPYQFVTQSSALLARLYIAGLMLPDVEPTNSDLVREDVPTEHIQKIYGDVKSKLGKYDYYWEIYDPFEDEPVVGSYTGGMPGDDFADIYRDIKSGLIAYSKGSEYDLRDIVWEWKFAFMSHWGRHLVDVLRAIHYLYSNYLINE